MELTDKSVFPGCISDGMHRYSLGECVHGLSADKYMNLPKEGKKERSLQVWEQLKTYFVNCVVFLFPIPVWIHADSSFPHIEVAPRTLWTEPSKHVPGCAGNPRPVFHLHSETSGAEGLFHLDGWWQYDPNHQLEALDGCHQGLDREGEIFFISAAYCWNIDRPQSRKTHKWNKWQQRCILQEAKNNGLNTRQTEKRSQRHKPTVMEDNHNSHAEWKDPSSLGIYSVTIFLTPALDLTAANQ